ncbi:MAG: glucose-6-phosphate isomerase, partial [Nitrospinaceae bacterium]
MNSIDLDYQNILSWVPEEELFARQGDVDRHHQALATGKGAGADYRGWMDLPSQMADSLLSRVEAEAARIREEAEAFVCIGIGGSYLGARAAITFCGHAFANALTPERRGGPEIYFAGQNISSDYLSDLLDVLGERKFCINVISKSGTTTEPAIAFRLLKNRLEHRFGRTGAQARIVVTTDQAKGALKQLADSEGYPSFVIPGNVGGRYSVLTPVGLLPIAVAGIPIRELLEGAGRLEEQMRTNSRLEENSAYLYAVIRNALYAKGKTMELMAGFHPALESILEWWKQLAGESEGKDQKGLFPASVQYTTDLHSLGQWVQEGNRILFETFLVMKNSNRQIDVPAASEDL